MKIIGLGQVDDSKTLIIEISQRKLEKLLGAYYSSKIPGKNIAVSNLLPGDNIDIEKIYSMTHELLNVQRQMLETISSFKEAQRTLLSFAELTLQGEN